MSDENPQRWEHRITHYWAAGDGRSWVDGPNARPMPHEGVTSLQADGWELVAVVPARDRTTPATFYLKRPVARLGGARPAPQEPST